MLDSCPNIRQIELEIGKKFFQTDFEEFAVIVEKFVVKIFPKLATGDHAVQIRVVMWCNNEANQDECYRVIFDKLFFEFIHKIFKKCVSTISTTHYSTTNRGELRVKF